MSIKATSLQRLEPSNPAKINWIHIKSFIQGYWRKFLLWIGYLDNHREQQIQWRKTQAVDCMNNRSCLFCGCTMPEKLYSDDACEDPVRQCYPEMMSSAEWEMYKLKNKIDLWDKKKL